MAHGARSHFSQSDVPGSKLATSQLAGTRYRGMNADAPVGQAVHGSEREVLCRL